MINRCVSEMKILLIILSIFSLTIKETSAWSVKIKTPQIPNFPSPSTLQKKCQGYMNVLCTTILISSQITIGSSLFYHDHNSVAAFASTLPLVEESNVNDVMIRSKFADENQNSVVDGIGLEAIQNSLAPPSEATPQIKLPMNSVGAATSASSSSSSSGAGFTKKIKSPILQGMVYMLNEQERPDLTDKIVITISSTANPTDILAGAKYDVYKARFPFQFKLYDANVVKGKEETFRNLSNQGDYLVSVKICPEDAKKLPCEENESAFSAKGISKLLQLQNLPGANPGDVIRTAASLPLEKNDNSIL